MNEATSEYHRLCVSSVAKCTQMRVVYVNMKKDILDQSHINVNCVGAECSASGITSDTWILTLELRISFAIGVEKRFLTKEI